LIKSSFHPPLVDFSMKGIFEGQKSRSILL
jgi:hypothetical protein